jgi:DNA-binding Lrp family transcriptional regulator
LIVGGEQPRPVQVDEVDGKILLLLAGDARLSARSIARQIGMSPGAVSERISRLEQRGVITGYRALVDPVVLGYSVHALVGVQTDQGPLLGKSIEQLMEIPEVASVHIVTGQWDLLVELRLRDNSQLLDVVTTKVYGIDGFRHCETLISLLVRGPGEGWLPRELASAEEPGARRRRAVTVAGRAENEKEDGERDGAAGS